MLQRIENTCKVIFTILAINAVTAPPTTVNEINRPTTGGYKDELFSALFHIYKLLKNHDLEQQLIQKDIRQQQYSQESIYQDLPSNLERRNIAVYENTDSYNNELLSSTETILHSTKLLESNENPRVDDLRYIEKMDRVQKKSNKYIKEKRASEFEQANTNSFFTTIKPLKYFQMSSTTTGKNKNIFFSSPFSTYKTSNDIDQEQQLIMKDIQNTKPPQESINQDLTSNLEGRTNAILGKADSLTNELPRSTNTKIYNSELYQSNVNPGVDDLSYVATKVVARNKHSLKRRRKEILNRNKRATSEHVKKSSKRIKRNRAVEFEKEEQYQPIFTTIKPLKPFQSDNRYTISNSPTTVNDKDNIFNALFSIYKILKNHEVEQQSIQRELPKKQNSIESNNQDLPSKLEERALTEIESTDSLTNKLLSRTEKAPHNSELYESNDNPGVDDLSLVGKRVIAKKRPLNRRRKETLKRSKAATSMHRGKNNKNIKENREVVFEKGNISNAFISTNKRSKARNDLLHKKYPSLLQTDDKTYVIPQDKYFKQNDKSIKKNNPLNVYKNAYLLQKDTESFKITTTKSIGYLTPQKESPRILQNSSISRIIHLKNTQNHQPKLQVFTKNQEGQTLLAPNYNLSSHNIIFNNNSPIAVTKNEDFTSENAGEKLMIPKTDMTKANSSSSFLMEKELLLHKNFETDGLPAKRKERVVTENSGNYSELTGSVFQNLIKGFFNYVMKHRAVDGIIVASIIVIIIVPIIVVILRRYKTKQRRCEAEKEYLLQKTNKTFSIGSEIDEDEGNHLVENDSYRKIPEFSETHNDVAQNVITQELEKKIHVLKSPEFSHLKLHKLHKNFSGRNGNVCYTDVLKNNKVKPSCDTAKYCPEKKSSSTPEKKNSLTPEKKNTLTLEKKNSETPEKKNSLTPGKKNSEIPEKKNLLYNPYLSEVSVKNCNCCKNCKIKEDFKEFSLFQSEDDDSDLPTESDGTIEDLDPSNPFSEPSDAKD